MKLKKVVFNENGFRNLHNLTIDISDNITVIAGHNGIGKSTILGLIANASEYTENKTLLNKDFRSEFSEVFILDYFEDFSQRDPEPSSADLTYKINDTEIIKRCAVSGTHKKLIKKNEYKKFLVKVNPSDLTDKQKESLNDDNLYVYRMRVIPRTLSSIGKEIGRASCRERVK